MAVAFCLPDLWPAPADPDAATRLLERFAPLDPDGRVPQALLRCLGGNSPYLADLWFKGHNVPAAVGIITIGVIGLVSDLAFKRLNRTLFAWAAL